MHTSGPANEFLLAVDPQRGATEAATPHATAGADGVFIHAEGASCCEALLAELLHSPGPGLGVPGRHAARPPLLL
ncbi:unnamed protein product [Rangifer tarandus platyrhynchus]|uniref:Uncharacterized protein n=1 Tax=Rangifer tarandus platyrhynchus TaxID=3082113 RepID=A0ABN8XJ78_RANTA|nr:unnamed protein product [Rangifer tarandus platyrhynchus]